MVTRTSVPMPAHEAGGGIFPARRVGRSLVVVLALVVSMLALLAVEAGAGSFDDSPPDAVLMKSSNVLQVQGFYWAHWFYYDEVDGWVEIYLDFYDTRFPNADAVRAGRRLHVRFRKPERPGAVEIKASPTRRFEQPQLLERTLEPVERDGKTVAWDVFFRVNQPDRDYYLHVVPEWDEVPGTHISYGDDMFYKLHIRTRA